MKDLRFKFQSFSFDQLKQIKKFIENCLQINEKYSNKIKMIFLPKKVRHYCLLRSPHIDKCSREQFKIVKYSLLVVIKDRVLTKEKFFELIKIPSGVLAYAVK